MKPSDRNRVYCPACNRHKLIFESESKALRFIKFNADSILEETGVAPIRAYFCQCCGGYHVTHQEKQPTYEESLLNKLDDIYSQIKESVDIIKDLVVQTDVDKQDVDFLFSDYVHLIIGYKKLAEKISSQEHIDNYNKCVKEINDILIKFIFRINDEAELAQEQERVSKYNLVKVIASVIKGLDTDNIELYNMCNEIIDLANKKIISTNLLIEQCDENSVIQIEMLIAKIQKNLKKGNYSAGLINVDRARKLILKLTGCEKVYEYIEIVKKLKNDIEVMSNVQENYGM